LVTVETLRREIELTEQNPVTTIWWLTRFALLSVAAIGAASAADVGRHSLVERVRAANERFQDVAVAEREGYAPIPCASGADGGAMGVHYVNPGLIAESVDIRRPQAVMYEPMPDGRLQLIAVEYITTKGPASLDNHLFNFTGAPNRYGLPPFYEMHVWAWKPNARGPFADMNPAVSCEHAHPGPQPAR
jgi:hypothetical protein